MHKIKADFPDLPIAINGGIKSHEDALLHLNTYESLPAVDGVMLGRSAYEQPFLLADVDHLYYQESASTLSRDQVVEHMLPYIESHLTNGGKLIQVTRHMLGLFHGLPGGRMRRRYLSQNAFKKSADVYVVRQAHQMVKDEIQRMHEQQILREANQ